MREALVLSLSFEEAGYKDGEDIKVYRDAHKEIQRVMKARNRARQAKEDNIPEPVNKKKDYFK